MIARWGRSIVIAGTNDLIVPPLLSLAVASFDARLTFRILLHDNWRAAGKKILIGRNVRFVRRRQNKQANQLFIDFRTLSRCKSGEVAG